MLHIKIQLNKIIKSIAYKKMLSVHIHNIKIMHVKIMFVIIKSATHNDISHKHYT